MTTKTIVIGIMPQEKIRERIEQLHRVHCRAIVALAVRCRTSS